MTERPGFDFEAAAREIWDALFPPHHENAIPRVLKRAYDAGRASRAPEPDAVREEKERVVAAARKWRDGGHHMLSTALERLEAAEAAAAPKPGSRFRASGSCVFDDEAKSQTRIWCAGNEQARRLAAAMNAAIREAGGTP